MNFVTSYPLSCLSSKMLLLQQKSKAITMYTLTKQFLIQIFSSSWKISETNFKKHAHKTKFFSTSFNLSVKKKKIAIIIYLEWKETPIPCLRNNNRLMDLITPMYYRNTTENSKVTRIMLYSKTSWEEAQQNLVSVLFKRF